MKALVALVCFVVSAPAFASFEKVCGSPSVGSETCVVHEVPGDNYFLVMSGSSTPRTITLTANSLSGSSIVKFMGKELVCENSICRKNFYEIDMSYGSDPGTFRATLIVNGAVVGTPDYLLR